jgi:hypothetical protein
MEDPGHQQGHLDETAIPGTVHLVDLEGTIQAKHASGAQIRDVVLVPAPSQDPDDPLNWSPRRKQLSTASQSMYTLMVGIASAAIYSVLEPIADDTGLTLADLNAGTGYVLIALICRQLADGFQIYVSPVWFVIVLSMWFLMQSTDS